MANYVNSKNIKGYLMVDSVYYQVFCGMSLDWRYSQELLETSNVNSGSVSDFEAGMGTATLSISGVHILDNTGSRISGNYLYQIMRTKQDWKVTQTDDDGDAVQYTFEGLIRDGGFNKSIPGYAKSDVNIQVCGPVTQTTVDPPPGGEYEIYSDSWATVNGQNYISGASSGNYEPPTTYTLVATDEILDVVVDGMPYYAVTGTPTNGSPEFNFDTGTLRINFPAGLVFDGSQKVFVMFKRYL